MLVALRTCDDNMHLRGANLRYANLRYAKTNEFSALPEGVIVPAEMES